MKILKRTNYSLDSYNMHDEEYYDTYMDNDKINQHIDCIINTDFDTLFSYKKSFRKKKNNKRR